MRKEPGFFRRGFASAMGVLVALLIVFPIVYIIFMLVMKFLLIK